jgi:hypothetical protein
MIYFKNKRKIHSIWLKYDKNFRSKLDVEEYDLFSKELNLIYIKTYSIPDPFKSIDKDNSSTIDFQEFLEYYTHFTNGEELSFVFKKYSILEVSSDENLMDISILISFYSEIQKVQIEEFDAQVLILLIKKQSQCRFYPK